MLGVNIRRNDRLSYIGMLCDTMHVLFNVVLMHRDVEVYDSADKVLHPTVVYYAVRKVDILSGGLKKILTFLPRSPLPKRNGGSREKGELPRLFFPSIFPPAEVFSM